MVILIQSCNPDSWYEPAISHHQTKLFNVSSVHGTRRGLPPWANPNDYYQVVNGDEQGLFIAKSHCIQLTRKAVEHYREQLHL